MGVFDSVMVPCPRCDTRVEFQSKSGPCLLDFWDLENTPIDILDDVNRHSPHLCPKCGVEFAVDVEARLPIIVP